MKHQVAPHQRMAQSVCRGVLLLGVLTSLVSCSGGANSKVRSPVALEPSVVAQSACIVPNIVGIEQGAAEKLLQALGLQPVNAVQYDAVNPLGRVVAQSPAPNTRFEPCKGAVVLTVSQGPAPITATLRPTTPPTPRPTATPFVVDLTEQRTFSNGAAHYDPAIESLLLTNGYTKNIITIGKLRGLRASQRNYSASVWSRDLDYAISGYSYALGDMTVFRESLELFLKRVAPDGLAPETVHLNRIGQALEYENRDSWDSMPNLIHAVYIYVAKTGDRECYTTYREQLLRVGTWILALDNDGNGLPDGDGFPYGYYDSLVNGVMHTYALAKFYAAFNELAALERLVGADGTAWNAYAARLHDGFHQPFDRGGYWLADQAWPIAWRRADKSAVTTLETFGVFEALRNGLISPADGDHYQKLIEALHTHLPELMDGPTPMKLTLGGYAQELRRTVDPPVPLWMLDASAPWIVGIAAPVYAAAGYPSDAKMLLDAYRVMAQRTTPPVMEFAAGPTARYGAGDSGDRGRTWDSSAWFLATYSGHYGLQMTPAALIVQPMPFQDLPHDGIDNLNYQQALVQFSLDVTQATYQLQVDRPLSVRLRPMGTATQMRLNGGAPRTEAALVLQPGQTYVVVSQ